MHQALASFTIRYNVNPADAYVLPALFERTAQRMGRSQSWLVQESLINAPVGEYLAECAAKVAREDRT